MLRVRRRGCCHPPGGMLRVRRRTSGPGSARCPPLLRLGLARCRAARSRGVGSRGPRRIRSRRGRRWERRAGVSCGRCFIPLDGARAHSSVRRRSIRRSQLGRVRSRRRAAVRRRAWPSRRSIGRARLAHGSEWRSGHPAAMTPACPHWLWPSLRSTQMPLQRPASRAAALS